MDEETLESATKLAARIQEISEGISSVLDGTEATLSEALDVFTYFIGKAVSEMCDNDDDASNMLCKLHDRIIFTTALHMRSPAFGDGEVSLH